MKAIRLDPGSLRNELILQEAVIVEDGAGGHTEDWREVDRLFAQIMPLRAESRFGAGQFLESVTHRVLLRQREDLKSGMRLLNDEQVLEIVTIEDADGTGRYLACLVRGEGR